MSSPDLLLAVKPVVAVFEALSIPYCIGGSVASSLYGMARATMDVDILAQITAPLVPKFVGLLKDSYYIDEHMILEALDSASYFNLIHLDTMMKIDVFIQKTDPFNQSALKRKQIDTLVEDDPDSDFYFYSPEDILLHKLCWYEMGGRVSERQWLDVLGIIKVQMDSLNQAYLKQWAQTLSVVDLLKQVFEEAGFPLSEE
jgi:hypothetical protein